MDDDPPLLHRADDRGEVVVGDHHRRRLFGDLGPADPHRDADVRLAQRRRVIDAVPRHRDHVPESLQRVHDSQFVLRRNTGEDARIAHGVEPRVVRKIGQLARVHGLQLVALRVDVHAELARNRGRGHLLVARDHHGANSGLAADLDRLLDLFAQRVAHPHQAHEGELAREVLFGVVGRQVAPRKREHAQRLGRKLVVYVQLEIPSLVGHRLVAIFSEDRCADVQQGARGSFHIGDAAPVRRVVDSDHQFGVTVERDLGRARIGLGQRVEIPARLLRGDDQRRLCGVAEHGGRFAGTVDLRVITQRANPKGERQRVIIVRVGSQRVVPVTEFAVRGITSARHLDPAPAHDQRTHRHLVACEGPRLVRANHGR